MKMKHIIHNNGKKDQNKVQKQYFYGKTCAI